RRRARRRRRRGNLGCFFLRLRLMGAAQEQRSRRYETHSHHDVALLWFCPRTCGNCAMRLLRVKPAERDLFARPLAAAANCGGRGVNWRAMDASERANLPRWRGQPGFYEIWFFVIFHPTAPRAWWLRFTTFAPTVGTPLAIRWAAVLEG